MNTKPKVYLPQQTMRRVGDTLVPAFDISPAAAYGDIRVIIGSGSPPVEMVSLIAYMRSQLQGFSDDDYIVAAGEPSVLIAAALVAAEYNDGRVKVLRWDRFIPGYKELQFDLKGEMENV
jgi:hypothetical protein